MVRKWATLSLALTLSTWVFRVRRKQPQIILLSDGGVDDVVIIVGAAVMLMGLVVVVVGLIVGLVTEGVGMMVIGGVIGVVRVIGVG